MGPDRMGLAGRIRRAQYASVCASIWGAHGTKVAFVGWWWVHKGRHGTVSPALLRAGLPGQPPWPILRIGLRCGRFSNVQDWLQCAGRIVRGLASPAGRARQVRPPEPEPPRHRETSRLAKIGEEDGRPLLRGRRRTGLGEGLRHCSLVSVLRDFASGTDFWWALCWRRILDPGACLTR